MASDSVRESSAPPEDYYPLFRDVSEDDWWNLWLAYAASPESRDDLPGFPPAEIQQRLHGTVWEGAIRGALALRYLAFRFVRNVVMRPIVPSLQVLDFGCGWGRLARVLLRDVHTGNLHGTDVDEEVIGIARQLLPQAHFSTNQRLAPLDHPADRFDLVFANSVFSHLAEPNFAFWIDELARVTRPGGLVIVTTWGRGLLDIAQKVFATGEREFPWQRNILNGFPSYEDMRARFDAGEFLFAGTGGGPYLPPSDFGIAMVPRAYFERNVRSLVLRDFLDDPAQFTQAILFAQKPVGALR